MRIACRGLLIFSHSILKIILRNSYKRSSEPIDKNKNTPVVCAVLMTWQASATEKVKVLVLNHLLISNGPNDGAILMGTFTPAKEDEAALLDLNTLTGDVRIEGEAASILFDFYVRQGTRIGSADYVTVSRDALTTFQLFFERLDLKSDLVTERRELGLRCFEIVKSLRART